MQLLQLHRPVTGHPRRQRHQGRQGQGGGGHLLHGHRQQGDHYRAVSPSGEFVIFLRIYNPDLNLNFDKHNQTV